MKTTVGQQKTTPNCICSFATPPHYACQSRGCSVGSNRDCIGTTSPNASDVIFYSGETDGYLGCNCPSSFPVATLNGFYGVRYGRDGISGSIRRNGTGGSIRRNGVGDSIIGTGYSYATCTDFGGSARDNNHHRPNNANDATDCCNYCCDRNDSRPNGLSGGAIAGIIIAIIVVGVAIVGTVWWWRYRHRRDYSHSNRQI